MGSRWKGCVGSPLSELLFLLQLELLHIVFERRRNFCLNAIKIWSTPLCSPGSSQCVGSMSALWWTYTTLPTGSTYSAMIHTFHRGATHTHTHIGQRVTLIITCTFAYTYNCNTLAVSRRTKQDKTSVLCSAVLSMMVLISMCPPRHNSAWLDWPLVRMTRGNLCLTGGSRNKSHSLRSGEQSTALLITVLFI